MASQPSPPAVPGTAQLPSHQGGGAGTTTAAAAAQHRVHQSSPLRPHSNKPFRLARTGSGGRGGGGSGGRGGGTRARRGRRGGRGGRGRTRLAGGPRIRPRPHRNSLRRASLMAVSAIRMQRQSAARRRTTKRTSSASPPSDLRWEALSNGTVRFGWRCSGVSGRESPAGKSARFMFQVATGPGADDSDDDDWEFEHGLVRGVGRCTTFLVCVAVGLVGGVRGAAVPCVVVSHHVCSLQVLELCVDGRRIPGLRLPPRGPEDPYRFRVAIVDRGFNLTWSTERTFSNNKPGKGGAQLRSTASRADMDRLMSTPRFGGDFFSTPGLPRLKSFRSKSRRKLVDLGSDQPPTSPAVSVSTVATADDRPDHADEDVWEERAPFLASSWCCVTRPSFHSNATACKHVPRHRSATLAPPLRPRHQCPTSRSMKPRSDRLMDGKRTRCVERSQMPRPLPR